MSVNCGKHAGRKFSFARRVCPVWNTLSHDVVNAFSVSSFKRKLDAVHLNLVTVSITCTQI